MIVHIFIIFKSTVWSILGQELFLFLNYHCLHHYRHYHHHRHHHRHHHHCSHLEMLCRWIIYSSRYSANTIQQRPTIDRFPFLVSIIIMTMMMMVMMMTMVVVMMMVGVENSKKPTLNWAIWACIDFHLMMMMMATIIVTLFRHKNKVLCLTSEKR